jgi:hypothetical protein
MKNNILSNTDPIARLGSFPEVHSIYFCIKKHLPESKSSENSFLTSHIKLKVSPLNFFPLSRTQSPDRGAVIT